MYAGLAYLAKERGLDEIAEVLLKISLDEARHAGLYAVLNGHTNEDIFEVIKKYAPGEKNAYEMLNQFASHVRDIGLDDAANHIKNIASDELRHSELLSNLINKGSK
ncbi:rubrerythrin [Clostridium bowmanii]|nr:rubrerythrin [Clostridium bowmanii]